MGKYLRIESQNEEIWKIILLYTKDKEQIVRLQSYKIVSSIKREGNFINIVNILEDIDELSSINKCLQTLIFTYHEEFLLEQVFLKFLNLTNRILLTKDQTKIQCIFLVIPQLLKVYGEKYLLEITQNIKMIDFQSKKNTASFIKFYSTLLPDVRKHFYSLIFYNIIKSHSYDLPEIIPQILISLVYIDDSDFDVYMKIAYKMLEISKWNQIEAVLKYIKKWKYTRPMFDRVVVYLTKVILISPYFLLNEIFESFYFLILLSRNKKLQFIANLKERLSCSKTYTHRRNYVLMYAYFYRKCSWEIQKCLPNIIFSMLLNEKIISVKLEYTSIIPIIYQYIDPSEIQFKANLRQLMKRFLQDKDSCIRYEAAVAQKIVIALDADTQRYQRSIQRNKEILQVERQVPQIEQQNFEVKQIHTQKVLPKPVSIKKYDIKRNSMGLSKQSKLAPLIINTKPIPKSFSTSVKTPLPPLVIPMSVKKNSSKK